jgi:hypothetical protein
MQHSEVGRQSGTPVESQTADSPTSHLCRVVNDCCAKCVAKAQVSGTSYVIAVRSQCGGLVAGTARLVCNCVGAHSSGRLKRCIGSLLRRYSSLNTNIQRQQGRMTVTGRPVRVQQHQAQRVWPQAQLGGTTIICVREVVISVAGV